jgi:SAM-dependent methyltransferase
MNSLSSIGLNIRAHDRIHNRYEQLHGEIFNPIEQERLHGKLEQAVNLVGTGSTKKLALDYGCGSGNLTRHLLALGLQTIATDVSPKFLAKVYQECAGAGILDVRQINGQDLACFADDHFDLVATYSVLHHVPDYLQIVEEFVRVLKPFGIIYIDHEYNPAYWKQEPCYREFLELVRPRKSWRRYFRLSTYYHKMKRFLTPRYSPEGDIHVWPDDHVEWDLIERVLEEKACQTVLKEDYLLYRRGVPQETYLAYKDHCTDVRVLIGQKIDS